MRVEGLADRANPTVHHIAGHNKAHAGLRMNQSLPAEQGHPLIV